MTLQKLYFIAIIPPHEIASEITAFKQDFSKNYNSSKALKVMPHITLKTPFWLNADDHVLLMDWFRSLQFKTPSFKIELKDFGSFENSKNPVIYVRPSMNESLLSLQQQLMQQFCYTFSDLKTSFIEQNFTPHMTVAYRDLSYTEFTKAWHIYKDKKYNATFEAEGFYLLQHDTRQWNIIAEHLL